MKNKAIYDKIKSYFTYLILHPASPGIQNLEDTMMYIEILEIENDYLRKEVKRLNGNLPYVLEKGNESKVYTAEGIEQLPIRFED